MIEILTEVLIVMLCAFLGSSFVKGAIDQFLAGRYYWCGFEIFGAFYIMLLMAKFVLK